MGARIKRMLTIAVVTALLCYIAGGVLLFLFQRSFLYFPTAKQHHDFEVEQFTTEEATLHVVVLNRGKGDAILYFGGNAEPVAGSATEFEQAFPDHTIYLVNYRGYGGSSGTPTEEGLYADGEAIYDTVKGRHTTVSIIGRSLGSGVATHVASTKEIHRLVLITPYDSIQSIAQSQYPMYPMSLMLLDKYESASRAGKIQAPTLAILAESDSIIPRASSERLIQAFPPDRIRAVTIAGAGHNSLSRKHEYWQHLRSHFE